MTEHEVFRNRRSLANWIFMSLWMGMLILFTWFFLRDGGFHQFSHEIEVGIMLVFWLGGLAGLSAMFRSPLIHVQRRGDRIIVTERWLLRRRIRDIPVAKIGPPRVRETTDSDGDRLYSCLIDLPDGDSIAFHETILREQAKARCDAFRQMVA